MKSLKSTLRIIAIGIAILTVQSCGNQEPKTEGTKTEKHDHHEENEEHEAMNTYVCPMHPEITGKKGDKCSECGMDLTLISEEDHSGHNH